MLFSVSVIPALKNELWFLCYPGRKANCSVEGESVKWKEDCPFSDDGLTKLALRLMQSKIKVDCAYEEEADETRTQLLLAKAAAGSHRPEMPEESLVATRLSPLPDYCLPWEEFGNNKAGFEAGVNGHNGGGQLALLGKNKTQMPTKPGLELQDEEDELEEGEWVDEAVDAFSSRTNGGGFDYRAGLADPPRVQFRVRKAHFHLY
jgi:hypothetical protein